MKQQQHDINFEEDSEKKSESQMGFEPTTLRDLVGCSNHLSYWKLYGEQGPICGSRLEPHHAATQPSNDWHTRTHQQHRAVTLKHTQDAANQPPK